MNYFFQNFDSWINSIQEKSEFNIRMALITNKIKLPRFTYEVSNKKILKNIESKFLKDYSLEDKIILAKIRIKEFIEKLQGIETSISFSGGKDSCVLRHLVHQVQDELNLKHSKCLIAAEFFHPETAKFLKNNTSKDDILVAPKKTWQQIIKEVGYPIISKQIAQKINHIRNTKNHSKYIRAILGLDNNKFATLPLKYIHFLDKEFCNYKISHKCCDYVKGNIKHDKMPTFIGTTIQESRLRRNSWLKTGCIVYEKGKPNMCKPLSLFTDNDIWNYIKMNNIKISKIYDLGYTRSGCVCCGFGLSLEEELKKKKIINFNRFELLYRSNKNLFDVFLKKYGMLKPIVDMGIKLNVDDEWILKEYKKREKQLIDWYESYDKNMNKILDEIEIRNPKIWTKEEREWIIKRYKRKEK